MADNFISQTPKILVHKPIQTIGSLSAYQTEICGIFPNLYPFSISAIIE